MRRIKQKIYLSLLLGCMVQGGGQKVVVALNNCLNRQPKILDQGYKQHKPKTYNLDSNPKLLETITLTYTKTFALLQRKY